MKDETAVRMIREHAQGLLAIQKALDKRNTTKAASHSMDMAFVHLADALRALGAR